MRNTDFIQSEPYSQALFWNARGLVYLNEQADKPSNTATKADDLAENPTRKPPGVPIDRQVSNADGKNPSKNAQKDLESKQPPDKVPANTAITDSAPRIPARSPEAMTSEQFRQALRACKTEEERRALYMDQVAKGNIPNSLRHFQKVVVNKGNLTVAFQVAPSALAFGTDDDPVEITPDAYTAAALADAFNCSLPTMWLVQETEKQPDAQRVHFFHQGEFAQELRDENGNPLNPNITHGAKTWSADFILKHNEKVREWGTRHNINWNNLVVGYYKDIVLPEPGVTRQGHLEIYGGLYDNGTRVQPLSGGRHEAGFRDYSGKLRLTSKVVIKNGVAMTAQQASQDPELMADPEIAKIIKGMTGQLPSYDYQKIAPLRDFVNTMRQNNQTYQLASSADQQQDFTSPTQSATTNQAQAKQPLQPPITSPRLSQPRTNEAKPEKASHPASGIPITADASSFSTSPTEVYASQPKQTPLGRTPSTSRSNDNFAPDLVGEQLETQSSNKVFVIGDSLSMGFSSKIKGFNVVHTHTKNNDDSTGAHTSDMLRALKNKILNNNVVNATLVVLGGTNDIFSPDSMEKIKTNLNQIYTLAKNAGMKVIAATLPPVGYSQYAKRNWEIVKKNPSYKNKFSSFEDYNGDLISRWNQLNDWILSRKGAADSVGQGPDEVVEFHHILENPNLKGSLTQDNYGEGGIHLKDYTVMGNAFTEAISRLNPGQENPSRSQKQTPQQADKTATSDEKNSDEKNSDQQIEPPTIESPSFKITSETKANIMPASDPSRELALAQNNQIRSNLTGYYPLTQSVSNLGQFASSILQSRPFGAIVYFNDGQQEYVAIKEWHPPYDQHHPEKPQKWHYGVSILKKGA